MELTIEQQRALALARARARAATTPAGTPQNALERPSDASQQPFERAGWGGAVGSGLADAGIKAYLGLKQLVPGGLSDTDKAVLREMKAEKEADPSKGWRTAGDVLGNIALTAIPASKAEKLLRGAAAVPGVLRAAGAAAGSSAAVEGLTSVGEGDTQAGQLADKAKNAGIAAATGGALSGTLQLLARPFRPTAEAQNLIRQGVNPTLQQGAEGKIGRFVGGLTSGAVNVRQRQEDELADALLSRITGGTRAAPGGTGQEYYETANQFVQDMYNPIFQGKRFPVAPKVVSEAQQAAQALNPRGQMMDEATQAGRTVANIMGNTGDRVRMLNYDSLRNDYLNRFREAADTAPNREVADRIKAARDVFINRVRDKRLSPDELQRLTEADILNFDVQRIREATRGAVDQNEGLSLARLATAYGNRSMPGNTTEAELIGPAVRTLGRTPRQDQARSALITAQRIAPALLGGAGTLAGITSLPATAAAVGGLYGVSALGQTAAGARALLGETDVQRALSAMLRQGVVAPAATAAVYQGE